MSDSPGSMALNALVDGYCAAWGQRDAAACMQALQAAMTPDASYCDPSVQLPNLPAIATHIGRLLQQFPDAQVRRTSRVDAHHGMARFEWRMVFGAGRPDAAGIDVIALSPDGRQIASVLGFFGPLSGDAKA